MVTLVLDQPTIRRLASDPAVVAAFPFLAAYKPVRTRGCCGASRAAPPATRAAEAVLALPPDRRAAFKRLAGADAVVVPVVRAARVVRETF